MTPIIYRQATALWPLSSIGRQQCYGPYRLQAGSSASGFYSESEIVREYSRVEGGSEAVRNRGVAEAF